MFFLLGFDKTSVSRVQEIKKHALHWAARCLHFLGLPIRLGCQYGSLREQAFQPTWWVFSAAEDLQRQTGHTWQCKRCDSAKINLGLLVSDNHNSCIDIIINKISSNFTMYCYSAGEFRSETKHKPARVVVFLDGSLSCSIERWCIRFEPRPLLNPLLFSSGTGVERSDGFPRQCSRCDEWWFLA